MNRHFRLALFGAGMYALYWAYCLYLSLFQSDARTQIVLAYVSFPTSFVLVTAGDSFLDMLGPYGDPIRRTAEWSLLLIAGLFQYFWLVYLLSLFFPIKQKF